MLYAGFVPPATSQSFLLLVLSVCGATAGSNGSYPYSPANYFHIPSTPAVLTVFPLAGKARNVPLPLALGSTVFGPDGKSLYTTGFDTGKQSETLLKVEFNPIRVSTVPGSLGFTVSNFAVSEREDKVVISGHYPPASRSCGVFELNLPGGDVRQVLESSNCTHRSTWSHLSLSPGGEQAVGLHHGQVELLDLANGTSRSLGSDFWTASWAPDGKWIAALKGKQSKLFLIDPNDLTHRRYLGKTGRGVFWSPDSRYLLLDKNQLRCGFTSYSIEILEVATGKRTFIKSSHCKVEGGAMGWFQGETR